MQTSKATIERLAKAWLSEAKRIQSRATCDCGCGQAISVTRFKPGHDAKLLREYRTKIHAILED
jgi:hypothetical protein